MALDLQAVELLLRFARLAHGAGGYPANELEPRIAELGEALGLAPLQVTARPTLVEITMGSIPDQEVFVLRVKPRRVDLHAISRLDEIADAVVDGTLPRDRALQELDELERFPLRRPLWMVVAASGLVSAGLAPILGGGWHEALGAAAVGLAVGFWTRVLLRTDRFAPLVAPLGALLASLLASTLAAVGLPILVSNVTYSALVFLLPGLSMAIGVRELATHHLEAGLANSANALVQLVGLVFGVAVGHSLAVSWFGVAPSYLSHPFPGPLIVAAAAVVGLAFVITLRASARDAIWTTCACVFAVLTSFVARRLLGSVAGVFAAALLVGLVGNLIGRRFRRSSLVFVVPAVLLLVPTGIGYRSATNLLAGQTLVGVDTAFGTFVTMLSISYGLVAAALILPDRPAGRSTRRRATGRSWIPWRRAVER